MSVHFLVPDASGHFVPTTEGAAPGANSGQFLSVMQELRDWHDGRGARGDNRGDTVETRQDSVNEFTIGRFREAGKLRGDAQGSFLPGALIQRAARVWETPIAPFDGRRIPRRAETAIGAELTEYARSEIAGEFAHYVGGQQTFPTVTETLDVEYTPVAHFVCVVPISYYERQSDSFANSGKLNRLLMGARSLDGQNDNKITWNGYAGTGLKGVLTHPGIPTSYDFSNWLVPATTGKTIVEEFSAWLMALPVLTDGVGMIDTVCVASKIVQVLASKPYSDYDSRTVWAVLKQNNPGINFVEATPGNPFPGFHSLNDVGPAGEHGMFGYLSSDPISAYVDEPQAATYLPPQERDLSTYIYVTTTKAGFKSFDRFNALLGYVPATTS